MNENAEKTDNLTNTPDVFISYSSKNKDIADAVVTEMEQHGVKCWYAPRDIRPGDQWVNAIKNALAQAGVFVIIYTEESNSSEQVKNEVALAFNAGKTIVPFKISDCTMDNELEYYLTRVHWMDAVNKPLENGIESLRELVEDLLENGNNISYKDNVELSKKNPAVKKKKGRVGLFLSLGAAVLVLILIAVIVFTGGLSFILVRSFGFGPSKMMSKGLEYYHTQYLGEEDNEKAEEYFEKAAKKGKEDAYFYLGMLYEREYDFENAARSYEKGIENGSSLSSVGLAKLYLDGSGVDLDIEKANELTNAAMDKGCVEAYYMEGILLQKGFSDRSEEADAALALQYYEKALETDDPEIKAKIYSQMGDIYKNGFAGVEKDFDKSLEFYQKEIECCESEEGAGYFNMAQLYSLYNEEIKADDCYRAAFKFYEKSAEAGNIGHMNRLGYLYDNGKGCTQDGEKALDWYKKAAENGNYVSVYNVGILYKFGSDPLKKNTEKAYEYFKKASDLGYSIAMGSIGDLYLDGEYGLVDGEPDYDRALQWFKKAAENGDYDSYSKLGDMYRDGNGVETDYEKAKEYYLTGCNKQSSEAMNSMGYYYSQGYEGKPDYEEAMKWFLKASNSGSSLAKRNIGMLYEDGNGVEQSYQEAAKWFLLSAEDNNSLAMGNLGVMYYLGYLEGKPDYGKSYKWFKQSADLGNESSMYMIGTLYYDGLLSDEPDYEKACEWYYKAIENGDCFSYGDLGDMYYEGIYFTKDIDKAKEYYSKGAELNDSTCSVMLGEIYYEEENYEGAVECYKRVWEESEEAAYRLGKIYYEGIKGVLASNYLSAKPYYKKAAELGMNDEAFWSEFGYVMFETGDYESAIKCFEKSFSFANNPMAAFRVGVNYFYLNDYENSAIWFAKALENGYNGDNDLKGTINEWVKDGLVIKAETLEYISPWLDN